METPIYHECKVNNALELKSLYTFSDQKLSSNYSFKGESHNFPEVVCVLSGKVGITADKNIYILSAGEMIIHTPNEFHAIWSDCGTSPEAMIFSFGTHNFPKLKQNIYGVTNERMNDLKHIYKLAEKAFVLKNDMVDKIREGMDIQASIVLKRLELFLLKILNEGNTLKPKYTVRSVENYGKILSVMENNLGESLSVKELASLCNMSIPALEKTIYRYFGCGAINYYNELKMQKARELLSEGMSVKETALTLGFSNQNYFSACYKKWSGYPPSLIRTDNL